MVYNTWGRRSLKVGKIAKKLIFLRKTYVKFVEKKISTIFFPNLFFILDSFMTEKVGISSNHYCETLKSMDHDSKTMLIIRGAKF